MLKTYKYRIYPTKQQKIQLERTFGSCRYIYNWALNFKSKRYQQYKQNVSRFELDKMVTFFKTTNELSWLRNANAQSLQAELRHLENAYTNFFRYNKGFPKFKKKNGKQSYECPRLVNIDFKNKNIKLPKIKNIKYRDNQTFNGIIKTSTVSKNKCNQYFVSILVEDSKKNPDKVKPEDNKSVGIDVGIRNFCTLSTGEKIQNPKILFKYEKTIKINQKKLSKKTINSNNRKKQIIKLAKIHNKVANIRADFISKLTTNLVKNHDTIFVEDLDIQAMHKKSTRSLSKAIYDASWREFYRQLEYKSDWYGKNLIKIGRFEPSSKMCNCGIINDSLQLKDVTWVCDGCGKTNDRDLLAANNIKKFGLMKLKYNTRQGMPDGSVDILQKQMVETETFVP